MLFVRDGIRDIGNPVQVHRIVRILNAKREKTGVNSI